LLCDFSRGAGSAALALALALALVGTTLALACIFAGGALWTTLALARVAAGGARWWLTATRSGAERADGPAVLAAGAHRGTRYAPCRRYAQTAAMSQTTKCAARTAPTAPLLGAPLKSPPPGTACRDALCMVCACRGPDFPSCQIGMQAWRVAAPGRPELFAHAAESRAQTSVVAPAPWCATTSSARLEADPVRPPGALAQDEERRERYRHTAPL